MYPLEPFLILSLAGSVDYIMIAFYVRDYIHLQVKTSLVCFCGSGLPHPNDFFFFYLPSIYIHLLTNLMMIAIEIYHIFYIPSSVEGHLGYF